MYFLVYISEKNRKKRGAGDFFTIFITICLMFNDGGRIMNFLIMCTIIKWQVGETACKVQTLFFHVNMHATAVIDKVKTAQGYTQTSKFSKSSNSINIDMCSV